ncbi:hypothetical protein F4824DRAFT_257366 [Ustulina deusta]|nr:hypothetical protein F4824DRAFT_257366 [Ustulina deusta]
MNAKRIGRTKWPRRGCFPRASRKRDIPSCSRSLFRVLLLARVCTRPLVFYRGHFSSLIIQIPRVIRTLHTDRLPHNLTPLPSPNPSPRPTSPKKTTPSLPDRRIPACQTQTEMTGGRGGRSRRQLLCLYICAPATYLSRPKFGCRSAQAYPLASHVPPNPTP